MGLISDATCAGQMADATPSLLAPAWLLYTLSFLALLSFATYALNIVLACCFFTEQNLKKKYDAEWALVTGASSGIGKALSIKLAKQGLNVVLAALDDDLLKNTTKELRKDFPDQEFRAVGIDLCKHAFPEPEGWQGGQGFMAKLRAATDDVCVQLIFNNAGFIRTGFFADLPAGAHLANYHCNATAGIEITHHYLTKLLASGRKGCARPDDHSRFFF